MDDTDSRELEVKMAWLENQVSDLDAVVRGLGDEIVALRREVAELRAAAATRRSEGDPADDEGDDEALRYESRRTTEGFEAPPGPALSIGTRAAR